MLLILNHMYIYLSTIVSTLIKAGEFNRDFVASDLPLCTRHIPDDITPVD